MLVFDAPVSPADLTTFVRRVPLPDNLTLSRLFPTVTKATNEVKFSEITKRNRTAKFRSFDGRIHVADRDGGSDKTVKLPALSDSRNQGEYERLQQEMARLGGTNQSAMSDAIYDDGQDLTSYVYNRMELALGDLLTDGKITINDNGFKAIIDYGVSAGNLPTAATAWNGAADILADLIAWCDAFEAANGSRPTTALTSRQTLRDMQTNTNLINAVKGAQTGSTRVSLDDLLSLFDGEGIPTNWVTYETQLDVDGVDTRVMPADRLTLLPANVEDVAEVRYGVSATALELVNSSQVDFSFEEAPGIVGVVVKEGPPFRQYTFVDAVGMPILKDAKKLFTAKVR